MKRPLLFMLLAAGLGISAEAEAQYTKNCLIEEFTSSTCPPCAGMNSWLDPLLNGRSANKPGSGLVVVKYQMNFPAPGSDASYNAAGQARASHYIAGMSRWGIPLHFTNGKYKDTLMGGGTNLNVVTNELNNCGGTSDLEITGSYVVKPIGPNKDSLYITITVTPSADLTGNFRLLVAATEEHYINDKVATGHTTPQTDYYHVMRKMYPSANGTQISSFTKDQPQTFTFADEVEVGNVTKGSYKWWSNPFSGSLVVFVSDWSKPVRSEANVLQAAAIPAQWPANVNEVSQFQNFRMFPNPATNQAVLVFNQARPADVAVRVTDLVGRVVYQLPAQPLSQGASRIVLPTDQLPNGHYLVHLLSEEGDMVQRLTVSK